MNYQLVNADVVRNQEVTVAEAGSGSLSYYAYAEIIMMTAAVVVTAPVSSAAVPIIVVNGSLSFLFSAAAAETVLGSNVILQGQRRPSGLLYSYSGKTGIG